MYNFNLKNKKGYTPMKTKATRRRMISCFAQIINEYVLGYKIPELVKDEKIKARKFSYDSQMYLLMLGQFLHACASFPVLHLDFFFHCYPIERTATFLSVAL